MTGADWVFLVGFRGVSAVCFGWLAVLCWRGRARSARNYSPRTRRWISIAFVFAAALNVIAALDSAL